MTPLYNVFLLVYWEDFKICLPFLIALHGKALWYPYFQVGQLLGPRSQSQEVKKVQTRPIVQKQLSESKPDPQEPSSDYKASSSKSHQHHQPIHQIQLPQIDSKIDGVTQAVSIFMKLQPFISR